MGSTNEHLTTIIITTSLGSISGRIFEDYIKKGTFDLHDPCWVIMRPDIFWIEDTKEIDDPETRRFNLNEAKMLGYRFNNNEMIEVEGDMITEYVPINPHENIINSYIRVTTDQIIYWYYPKNADEIDSYVDRVMGRSPMKEVNEKQ